MAMAVLNQVHHQDAGAGPLDRGWAGPTNARASYADQIRELHRQVVEGFIQTGRLLIEAKAALPHGDFEAMVEEDLPFGARTAQRLMAIASHPILSKATHASHLPSSWMTVHELTKVSLPVLEAALADGRITPAMQRKDVTTLLPARTDAALSGRIERAVKAATAKGAKPTPKKVLKALCKALWKLREDFGQHPEFALLTLPVGDTTYYLLGAIAPLPKAGKARPPRPEGRWECPDCGEVSDGADLVVIRQCSSDMCGETFNGDESGQNCPQCNRTFTRRLHDLGCPSCGTNEEECFEAEDEPAHAAEPAVECLEGGRRGADVVDRHREPAASHAKGEAS